MPALADEPASPSAAFVLAHGAGAGMHHAFLAALATGLAQRGIACLRFQFPFMAAGSKRPDAPAVAQEAVRIAVAAAARRWPQLPLFAGGKSFGGRMSSQAQAAAPLPGVRGLVFAGFPLHPAKKPATARADHLRDVRVPMLFLQGTRDALAEFGLIEGVVRGLGSLATLQAIDGADHSFAVPARSGRKAPDVEAELLDAIAGWIAAQR
ncbi:alpha/beta hydrolase [Ramlibacter humi]|uniref:Alpha/beta hydrolase n=1 Tax=Ramlibacter humi TaxID=2530451 RepID=A0A4Z0BEA9_9BURK|nr:alpha/beta hydrolase [Ramlibacter humi]